MVSKASELFPGPETPLITVSIPWGISQEMFFRLCVRAPRMMMASFKGKHRARIRADCIAGPTARLRAQTAILYYRARGNGNASRPLCRKQRGCGPPLNASDSLEFKPPGKGIG